MSTNFDSLKGLDDSQGQAVVDIYMKTVKGVFLLARAEINLAVMLSFIMKNSEVVDELEDSTGNNEASSQGKREDPIVEEKTQELE
jgi:hypothetical protein